MTHEESLQLVETVFELHDFFDDNDKVAAWLITRNPHLGDMEPIDFFFRGRGHKVLKFIRSARKGNLP